MVLWLMPASECSGSVVAECSGSVVAVAVVAEELHEMWRRWRSHLRHYTTPCDISLGIPLLCYYHYTHSTACVMSQMAKSYICGTNLLTTFQLRLPLLPKYLRTKSKARVMSHMAPLMSRMTEWYTIQTMAPDEVTHTCTHTHTHAHTHTHIHTTI